MFTPREQLITELWKADSFPTGIRLIELDEKAQDTGLTADEEREYAEVKAEDSRLFREYLAAMYGAKFDGGPA